jgi:predicted transcriptional regulator
MSGHVDGQSGTSANHGNGTASPEGSPTPGAGTEGRIWTFLSNHGHVLILLSQNPEIRLRDVASKVGITERAATGIINDLVASGYVSRTKDGRRNRYTVHKNRRFRHPQEADHSIDELLRIFESR